MIAQIKKWGDSNVIVMTKDFMKYLDATTGDFINMSDVYKMKKVKNEN